MIIQIQPFINEEELGQLKRVIDSTFVTEHKLTEEFENFFKEYTESKYVLAYTNGTMALFAVLKSLGIGEDDEVILPDMTFIATANAVIMAGAKPVFCDMKGNNFNINLDFAKKIITKKTKAIIPVHLYGTADNIELIIEFAQKYNLKIVEDAAQGVGVRLNGKHVGTFGDASILSFYGNKTITTGEGGIILTDNEDIAKFCYSFKNHGRDKKGIFIHENIGYNFSFTEMQAAIGIAQTNKLERIILRKSEIYEKYYDELNYIKGIKFSKISSNISPVFWFTNIFISNAEDLSEFLYKKGIQTRRFFYPLHLQPCYSSLKIKHEFPVSEMLYNTGLSLPSSYQLTNKEQSYVIEKIKEYFGE